MSDGGQNIEERIAARKLIPEPCPAYLPKSGSPLIVNEAQYAEFQQASRTLIDSFLLPIRSGRAWKAPAGSIVRISTPEGPQVVKSPTSFYTSVTRVAHTPDLSHPYNFHAIHTSSRLIGAYSSVKDTLSWYGIDQYGGRVHDLLGTRCDPYINTVLAGAGASYDFHCHSNLTRAVLPFGLNESDVHDVINLFQVTGLDKDGRYFMNPCPAQAGDHIELFAEQDLLMALSTCPGGDLSQWGFGSDSEKEMLKCCRPLKVEVFVLEDQHLLHRTGWTPAERPPYQNMHGMAIPSGGTR